MIVELARDQVDTLDDVVIGVEYMNDLNIIKIRFNFGDCMYLTEQDLITLLSFLRTNRQEKVNG